jgi:hypothetical protein
VDVNETKSSGKNDTVNNTS